jgi:Carboxypeptidase regulatory-like domain
MSRLGKLKALLAGWGKSIRVNVHPIEVNVYSTRQVVRMKLKVLLTIVMAGCLFLSRTAATQPVGAGAPAYVDENQTDPAPLKLREVEGSVVGLGGDGIQRASVSLFNELGHTLVATALSDKDGKFHFNKVDKGAYRLVVRVPGLCTANVPLVVESSLLAHRKVVVTMQAKDIDTCSYGMTK